jgi:hypothetical protein
MEVDWNKNIKKSSTKKVASLRKEIKDIGLVDSAFSLILLVCSPSSNHCYK